MAIINGTSISDLLNGTAASDTIDGGAGDDTINGGAGQDFLVGGAGNDSIDGGADEDTVAFNYPTSEITSLSGVSGTFTGGTLTVIGTEGTDTLVNFEALQFSDQTVAVSEVIVGSVSDDALNGTTAADLISGGQGNDTISADAGYDRIWGGLGVNTIDGGAGIDTVVFDYSSSQIVQISSLNQQLTVNGATSTDILSNVEFLKFSDQLIDANALILGTASAQTIAGTAQADVIAAGAGADTILASAGDDLVVGAEDGETINGGDGIDTVKFNFSKTELTAATRLLDGSLQLTTEQPTILLSNVEKIAFSDSEVGVVDDLISELSGVAALFYLPDGAGGAVGIAPDAYVGPVTYLQYQLLGDANSNTVTASANNDFLNLLGGNDAADGGDGLDVLDGGTGSNFLTGGNDADTFFLDGRGGDVTWSTITDFTNGDSVNIWGWVSGTSNLILVEQSNGAAGYEGVTLHYDLDGNAQIDTSVTFTGLTEAQLPQADEREVADNGYLFFTL